MKYTLDEKEFYSIVSGLGVETIYGMSDVFEDKSDDEIEAELAKVQASLTDKGYISMDFDGNVLFDENFINFMSAFSSLQKVIAFDKKSIDGEFTNTILYICDGTIIKAECKDDLYELSSDDTQVAFEDLDALFNKVDNNPGLKQTRTLLLSSEVEKIKKLLEFKFFDDAKKGLADLGVEGSLVDFLLDMLNEKKNIYTLTFIDYSDGTDDLEMVYKYFMYAIDEDKIIQIDDDAIDNDDAIAIVVQSTGEFVGKIKDAFKRFGVNI